MAKGLKGLEKVVANLNKEISKIQDRGRDGLLAAGLMIQRGAQKRVPVEYGNLKASGYTHWSDKTEGAVVVGFGAEYAAAVHEKIEVHRGEPRRSGIGSYWGPHGEPKFLEKELAESHDKIIQTIAQRAKVKSNAGKG